MSQWRNIKRVDCYKPHCPKQRHSAKHPGGELHRANWQYAPNAHEAGTDEKPRNAHFMLCVFEAYAGDVGDERMGKQVLYNLQGRVFAAKIGSAPKSQDCLHH